MPQKNAFIIDEDREFATRVAAALRTDGLKVSIAEEGRDPLEELSHDRPDIILMRADSRESESGFALCSRMKTSRRLAGLPIFLYSAEVDDQTFEHHRQQEGAADAYIRFPTAPPYPMEDLRARVLDALSTNETSADLIPPNDALAPDAGANPSADPAADSLAPVQPITDEDNAFLDRVLDSLQQGTPDEEGTTVPPLRSSSVTSRRTTADAKLDMLRQKLRQREFELAKVMEMYRAKEREYHEWNEKLVEKDVEAQALKVTIEDYQRNVETTQSELDRRTVEFNASFEQLLEEKVTRENELIHAVATKEKELADTREVLRRVEQEVGKLTKSLAETQTAAEQAEQTHQTSFAELRTQLDERDGTLASLEQALADTQTRVAELELISDSQGESLTQRGEIVLQLQTLVLALRSDLADARDSLDESSAQHQYETQAYDEIIDGLQGDLTEAEASYVRLETSLQSEIAELSADLNARKERLRSSVVAQVDLEGAFKALQLRSTAKEAELHGRVQGLKDTLDSERVDRADAEGELEAELQSARQKVTNLQESITDLEMVSGERIRVLGEQVEERESNIAQLRDVLEEQRDRFREVETALKEANADLEARRQGLQAEVDQRMAELAENEASHAEAIAAREDTQRRLEAELRSANDEVASLNAEIAEVQNHLEELEQTKTEMEADFNQQLDGQLHALASTREAANTRETQLRDQIASLNSDVSSRGERIDALASRLDNETRERETAERLIVGLQQDLESERARFLEAQQTGVEKDDVIHQLRETVASREGRIVELQEGLRNEHAARQDQESKLGDLRVEHDARNEKIGRLEAQVASQDQMLQDLRHEMARLQSDLSTSHEASAELRAQLAVSRSSAEERTVRLQENVRRLDEREGELAGVRAQLADVTGARDRSTEAKEQLERQLDEARREWSMVREELVAERHRLNQRLEVVQSDLEATRSTRDGLASETARLEEQRDALVQREEELRIDLEARVAHGAAIDRELEAERAGRVMAEETVERLRGELAELSVSSRTASETADHQLRELETKVRQMTDQHADAVAETDQTRRALTTELDQARARIDALSSQVAALSADRDGLGDEASTLSRRLDDAMARSANLATEKASVEEQRANEVRKLEQQLRQRDDAIAAQQTENEKLNDAVRRLSGELTEFKRDREEVENKYVRELEEVHDEYMQKAKGTDVEHAREVENLRKTAIDAKRQLKTAQLAAQRLEDRLRRLEAERPARSDVSADFESFIAQFADSPPRGDRRRGLSPPKPASGANRPLVPSSSKAADALASSATVPVNEREEEEVTDVGAQIVTPSRSRPTAPKGRGSGRKEPDDFLAAFDKEFEDIKGG